MNRFELNDQVKENKTNSVIVILCRNSDLSGLNQSLTQFEDRFNKKYKYPYVFLNDKIFTNEFKSSILKLISSKAEFGLIKDDEWSFPHWINISKAEETRKVMKQKNIAYGSSISYRHMCRYNSGFFFKHELLLKYDYYWRIEPSVNFTCDINYDPFLFMKENNKYYGFTIMLPEFEETIPTLWNTTQSFLQSYPQYLHPNNVLQELMLPEGHFNYCHFWSNFEIANLNFFRSEPYLKYFDYLDKNGGFFYERWGDAPIHSLAVAMFLSKENIHYFDDIGYYHEPFGHCPLNPVLKKNCNCNNYQTVNFNFCHFYYMRLYYL